MGVATIANRGSNLLVTASLLELVPALARHLFSLMPF